MKTILAIYALAFAMALASQTPQVSVAATTTEETSKPDSKKGAAAPEHNQSKSQTEHSFEDLLVQGKYHFSDESVTTVEEDKVLDALIGVRTDFKDRLESSAGKY